MIVKDDSSSIDSPYEGMDRPPLGSLRDLPEDLVLRGMALEDLPDPIAETHYREFPSTATSDHSGTMRGDVVHGVYCARAVSR